MSGGGVSSAGDMGAGGRQQEQRRWLGRPRAASAPARPGHVARAAAARSGKAPPCWWGKGQE
eukprot:2219577-Pleurochrysis_carterae.AAC.1